MTVLDQARRIDQIRALNGVQNVLDCDSRGEEAHWIRRYLKFGNAPALYDDGRNAVQPVESRLKGVGSNFPQLFRLDRFRRQALTNHGEDRESERMCFH